MNIKNLLGETTFLEPVRLKSTVEISSRPEVVLRRSPQQELVVNLSRDQGMRLDAGKTARVMGAMDKSATRLPVKGGGRGFGGVLRTDEGEEVTFRGRGGILRQSVRQLGQPDASGCREVVISERERVEADGRVVTKGGDEILFLVTESPNLVAAEGLLGRYEGDIAGLSWSETTQVTMARERELRVVARELRDAGKPVMYVTTVSGEADAIELVGGLTMAPLISRFVVKAGMKIGAVARGEKVGLYGRVVGREKDVEKQPQKVTPLLMSG